MKIFLSWSGQQSKFIANALKDWIPDVLQEIQPWMSEHDIKAGSRWSKELGEQLLACDFGILTISQNNQNAPWLLFEAGSLAKAFNEAKVIPYLIGLKPTDLQFPLAQFQSVEASKEGTYKMIQALNSVLKKPVASERLKRVFERSWQDFAERLKHLPSEQSEHKKRSERELLEEVLQTVRETSERINNPAIVESEYDGAGLKYPTRLWKSQVFVDVFTHTNGFPRKEAEAYCAFLKSNGIPFRIIEHRDPAPPDSIFIGSLVDASTAFTVLAHIPHEVRYIFPLNYPEAQGGDNTGCKIGIGYMSSHNLKNRMSESTPIGITNADLKKLLKPGMTNTEFQIELRNLLGGKRAC